MNIISLMITILSMAFWVFRLVVCMLETLEVEFVFKALNLTLEIGLLFASIPCFVFVFKINIIGAAAYMGLYVSYFGTALFNTWTQTNADQGLNVGNSFEEMIAIVGVALGVLTFLDVLFNKYRKSIAGSHKSTDWYYNNDKYEREYDERADKNQYRNY